jgi:chitinase
VAQGTYNITAKAYDNLNASAISAPVTITVKSCSYASWSPTTIYTVGNRAERNGNVYEAKWWTQNNDPLTFSGTYDVWKKLGSCGTDLMPSISVVSTATGDTIAAPVNFNLSVNSHDDEGYVTRIEIFNLDNLVSQYFTGTASYTFSNLPAGLHEIYVKVYDNAGNVAVSDTLKYFIKSDVTAIFNPKSDSKINVYPNPITGRELSVEYPNSQKGPVQITIIDLNGKEMLMFKEEGGSDKEILNVSALQPGMYIMKMIVDGQEYEEKIQKASRPKTK